MSIDSFFTLLILPHRLIHMIDLETNNDSKFIHIVATITTKLTWIFIYTYNAPMSLGPESRYAYPKVILFI